MPKQLKNVKGVILPADWDSKGNVTAVSISAIDETEYLVENYGRGRELMTLINQEVAALGKTWGDGISRVIEVTDYSILRKQ